MDTNKYYSTGIKIDNNNTVVMVPPIATDSISGGIIAKAKTTEDLEVAIDNTTGKLYAPGDEVTTSSKGLMSSTDKTKLDGIADGANNYTLPTASTTLGGVKTTSSVSSTSGLTAAPIIDGVVYYKDTNTTNLSSMTGTLGIAHGGTGASSAADALSNLGLTATATELNYSDGVTSNIQTQLDSKPGKSVATQSADGLLSSTDKIKLDGIADGANNYSHPTYTAKSSGLYKITVDGTGHVSATTAVAKADITSLGIPAQDTTYSAATTSTAGLMSASDKTKLESIADGANNYSHPTYTSKTSGLYKITVDGTGHVSAATAVAKADITGLGIPAQDTTYSVATQSANGLMSASDKTKLDGIAAGANNYSLPTAGTNTLGGVKTTSTVTSTTGLTASPIINGNVYYKDTNTTYSAATTSAAGLMGADDKTKLDGIATGANNYSHPSSHAATMITEDTTHRFVTDTEKSAWNAKVGLDSNGLIPSSVLPSFVDDVIEGYLSSSKFYKTRSGTSGSYTYSSEITGESGKIYVDLESNKTYRYSGSTFVIISETLALGETSSTAYAGNKGKANADAIAAITNGTTTVPSASNAATVNNLTVLTAVPANAKFTDTTYSVATQSANGLLSSTDKTKLDGIAAGANNYSLPTAGTNTLGGVKTTSTVTSTSGLTASPIINGNVYYKDTNTTYSAATTSAAGLMSATDKTKLDGTPLFVTLTQDAYDNLETKSDNTIYIIIDDSVASSPSLLQRVLQLENQVDDIQSGRTNVLIDQNTISSTE